MQCCLSCTRACALGWLCFPLTHEYMLFRIPPRNICYLQVIAWKIYLFDKRIRSDTWEYVTVGNSAGAQIQSTSFRDHSFSSTQNIPKTNSFHPLMRPCTCAYHGVRIVSFSENFAKVLNKRSLAILVMLKEK